MTALATRPAESSTALAGLPLTLRLPSSRTTAMPLAVTVRVELAALTDREIRRLALWYVPLWPRQLRANQRPVHRPLVTVVVAALALVFDDVAIGAVRGRRGGEPGLLLGIDSQDCLGGFGSPIVVGRFGGLVQRRKFFVHVGFFRQPRGTFHELRRGHTRLATPRCRHLRLFIFVFRVAGRAPRLLDSVLDHRDHGMVGNAALARTVVV